MTAASVRTMREICRLMLSISYRLFALSCRSGLRKVRVGDHRCRNGVDSAVSLQQSLMRRRNEREPRQKVLVIRFDALGQAGRWIAGNDEADQDCIHVHLMTIRCSATTEAPAIGELGIDCGIERNDIAR